jgi:hypothetical protein
MRLTDDCRRDKENARRGAIAIALASAALTFGSAGCGEIAGDEPNHIEEIGEKTAALGSTESLQMISTLAQLRAMTLTGNYRLANNIDASPTGGAGQQFVPIGSPFNPFRGTFDGNNKTINNLRIDTGGGWYVGLFSGVDSAIIKNVGLTNVNVSGGGFTGAIAGMISNSQVTFSYVTGTVTGTSQATGMAIGQIGSSVTVNRCYATGTVTGSTTTIGGFVGEISAWGGETGRSTVTEVFTNVNVNPSLAGSGNILAGGLAGQVKNGWIESINTVGNVLGRGYAGGVIGEVINDDPNYGGTVFDYCISRGIVTVSGTPNRAGTLGHFTGSFLHCQSYWNTTTDGGSPPSDSLVCQIGVDANTLKAPHPSPNKLISPYIQGQLVTQQLIDEQGLDQCKLGSGSDTDWGFGTCGTVQLWALNSSTEYITLTRIPNPGVQPK